MMKYNNDITFSRRFTQFTQQSFHKQILDPLKIFISYERGWNKQVGNAFMFMTEVILNKFNSARDRL